MTRDAVKRYAALHETPGVLVRVHELGAGGEFAAQSKLEG